MTARDRRGFTMVELIVALILLLVVGGGMYSMLVGVQRISRRQTEISVLQGGLRTGLQLVQSELQEVAANSGTGQSDILSMSGSAFSYRAMRGLGETCAVTGSAVKVRQSSWSGLRSPAGPRESLFLFVDGADSASTADDSWMRVDGPTITTSTCPDASPAWSFAVTLSAGQLATIRAPGPVRTFESMELGRITDDGQDWLGMRSISAGEGVLVPVVGPVTANGVGFAYYDINGATTTTASAVKMIVITLRGITQFQANAGMSGQLARRVDSLSVRVQLRNAL